MPPETVESTAAEQPANDLTSDLEAAYDQYSESEEQDDGNTGNDSSEQSANAADADEAGNGGEQGEGEISEQDSEADGERSASQDGEQEKLTAPEHWRAEHKEVFEKLDDEGKKFLLERHKEMEGDYTRKRQQDSDLIKQAESLQPINEMFKQFPHLQPVPTIQRWAGIAKSLEQNPKETIAELAKQYRVDLGGLEQSDEFVDPKVQSLEQQLRSLQQSIVQQEHQKTEQQQTETLNQIKAFSEAKTEAGEPAHPHFDELYPDMIRLAHAERAAGREPSLEKLYQDAQWINPQVREQIQTAQRKAAEKKAEEEARAKAEKARKAAKTATQGNGLDSPSDDLGLREQIASQF